MVDSKRVFVLSAVALAAILTVAGCGGGSGDSTLVVPTPAATTLTGVAAVGAPMAGAAVTVIDSDNSTADATTTAAANGSYSVDVSSLKAPFIIKVVGQVDGDPVTLVALVPAVSANVANTANITPLTHAVASLLAPGGDPLALLSVAALAANLTPQKLADAVALLVNTLKSDPAIAAALGSDFDPLRTSFSANGNGIDAVIDKLSVEVGSSGVRITNLAAPVSGTGTLAVVVLTAAQTSTPAVAPTLPPSVATGEIPTAADLAALAAKYQACLALPVKDRVSLAADGSTVTAVSDTCNYAPAGWKSDGRSWVQQVGQFTFAKTQLNGAKVGKPSIVFTAAADNLSAANEFKHPYCNTATCVVVRIPLTMASGAPSAGDWLVGKVNGSWNFVGNQRPYRMYVEPRLNRREAVNTAGAAPGSTTDPYYFTSRFESVMRTIVDLSVGDTSNLRAARFTGPGLPAAGLVMFRSQRCATDDRMGITYQTGSTRNSNNQLVYWTGATGTEFVLDAATLAGAALAMPSSTSNAIMSPAPVANQSANIPAWSRYKVELFYFSTLSDNPDEVIYLRTNAPAENAALGAGKTWPVLSPGVIEDYLKPTGAAAGVVSSLATQISWTAAAGIYVGSGYIYGGISATATNAQSETATFALGSRIDLEPAVLGNLTATAVAFANFASGTSLSSHTATIGTNPNPLCTSSNVVALGSGTSDYREVGISFRGSDRKLYQAQWFWDR